MDIGWFSRIDTFVSVCWSEMHTEREKKPRISFSRWREVTLFFFEMNERCHNFESGKKRSTI